MKAILFLFLLSLAFSQEHDIEITQLEFISNFSLGKQNELNITFDKIHQKFPTVPDVIYNASSFVSYDISNISSPHFFYIDSKQTAIIEDGEVTISGGKLETDFTFNWTRKSSSGVNIFGWATAFGFSDKLIFSKSLVDDRENKILYWDLVDIQNITFDDGFKVIRVHPENTTQDDFVAIHKAINYIQDELSVKDHIIDLLDSVYGYFLSNLLNSERTHFLGEYDYTFQNKHTQKKHDINMTLDLKDVVLDRTGIKFDWKTQILNDPDWKWLNYHVGLPFPVEDYGGIQEFMSFTVYENLAKFAIKQGWLDTVLNQRGWESRFFQFYAGDLYEVIPKVAEKFRANEPINGLCVAIPAAFTIKKSTDKTINVTMEYGCELNSQSQKIIDFNLKLDVEIEGIPKERHMKFKIDRHDFSVTFSPYMDYKVEKEDLARKMIQHSLNRLPESDIFGNGWQLLTRDYPHFHVEHEYTLVYDSTHVESVPTFENE